MEDDLKGIYNRELRKLAGKPKPEQKPLPGKKTKAQIGFFSAGHYIKYFLIKNGMKAYDLQFKTHIPHQRIYDYISGKRRLTIEASILIEKALNLPYRRGYLYLKQAEHDLYVYKHPPKKKEEIENKEE